MVFFMDEENLIDDVNELLYNCSSTKYLTTIVDLPRYDKEIVLYGEKFDVASNRCYFQLYDINNKKIEFLQSYHSDLEDIHHDLHKQELLEDVVRAYLDNAGFMALLKEESTDECEAVLLNVNTHTNKQYRAALYGFSKGIKMIHQWIDKNVISPNEDDLKRWLKLGEGIRNSIQLYIDILSRFREDVIKMSMKTTTMNDLNLILMDDNKTKYLDLDYENEKTIGSLKIRNAIKRGYL